MSGTLTPSPVSCEILEGSSSCTVTLNWSITNPAASTTAITASGMSNVNVGTSVSPSYQSGSHSFSISYSSSPKTFYLYNNSEPPLAQSTATAGCKSGTSWNGSQCEKTQPNVDGGWTNWSSWSACSVTACGQSGTQTRTRTCTNPVPSGTGANCSGYPTDTQSCSTSACLSQETLYYNSSTDSKVGITSPPSQAFSVQFTPPSSNTYENISFSGQVKVDVSTYPAGVEVWVYVDGAFVGRTPISPDYYYNNSWYSANISNSSLSSLSSGAHTLTVLLSRTGPGPGGTAYLKDFTIKGSPVAPSPMPDLTASNATPTSATAGVATTLSALIQNIGDASTGSSFMNFFQVATNPNGNGNISDLTATTMSTLAAYTSNTATQSYTFPSNGSYSIRACADKSSSGSSGTISESNENNNCGSWINVAVSSAPVDGSCSGTHYNCSAGTSASNVDGSSSWTWICSGSNGGSNASCSETKSIMSGTLTPSPATCTISAGSNSCTANFSWTTTNPVGTSAITSGTNNSGATSPNFTVATGNSGTNIAFTLPYINDGNHVARNFYLYNNSQPLAQSSGTASCTSGTSWNGSVCATVVDGGWSSWSGWSAWSACSVTACGQTGTQTHTRTRTCTNPTPANGGANCSDSPPGVGTTDVGSQSCSTPACPTDAVCGSTHYNCSAGVSSNNLDNTNSWTWSCTGANGGNNVSCSEAKKKPVFIEN